MKANVISEVNYCRAYPIGKLRQFQGWREANSPGIGATPAVPAVNPRPSDGKGSEMIVFLHADYVVTEGPFRSTATIFGEVTKDWKRFCEEYLGFEVPDL